MGGHEYHNAGGKTFTDHPVHCILFVMKRPSPRPNRLMFLIVAVALVVFADRFLFDNTRPYIEEARNTQSLQTDIKDITAPVVFLPEPPQEEDKTGIEEVAYNENIPAWIQHSVAVQVPPDRIKVAIIIDDLGENVKGTRNIIALPGPLTLAYLPYPKNVQKFVTAGHGAGHEIMVHMPMEPMDGTLGRGSYLLRHDMTPDELRQTLIDNLDRFDGYVGINNHMGSRLTQDRDAMTIIMTELRKRGLLFVDSRTISTSVAATTAAAHGIPYASRHVFLDHDPSLESVRNSLMKLEAVARDSGSAIAIGHPKSSTIKALQEWLPTLAEKGIALVPVSMLVTHEETPLH